MSSNGWKTFILPPLSALVLYLLTTHLLLPLYNRFILTSRYTPLPNSTNSSPSQLFLDVRTRVADLLGRARRGSLNAEIEGFLGDEELEEGVQVMGSRGREDIQGSSGSAGERRLGRELEGGFMDDSDEEEAEEDCRRWRRHKDDLRGIRSTGVVSERPG